MLNNILSTNSTCISYCKLYLRYKVTKRKSCLCFQVLCKIIATYPSFNCFNKTFVFVFFWFFFDNSIILMNYIFKIKNIVLIINLVWSYVKHLPVKIEFKHFGTLVSRKQYDLQQICISDRNFAEEFNGKTAYKSDYKYINYIFAKRKENGLVYDV